MPQYPKTVMDLYSLSDIGRRLVDPGPAYQSLQMMFGWQTVQATLVPPGGLLSMAVNVAQGPPLGTGNSLWVMLPFALAGRPLTVINLAASTLLVNTQLYNPATEKPDGLVYGAGSIPLAIGSLSTFLAYSPGNWVLTSTAASPALATEE